MAPSQQIEEIKTVVETIFRTREKLARLSKVHTLTEPGGPASEAAIRKVEAELGRPLPPDYRTFLSLHDGWPGFVGDNDILSTSQLLGGKMRERVAQIKAQMKSEEDHRAAHGFIIVASLFNWHVVYFDVDKKRNNGGLDVVFWDHGPEERFRSFLAYLKDKIKTFEGRVTDEQSKLRISRKKK